MRALEYVLLDPTGNVTALVTDPVEIARQPALARALMRAEPAAEQVGFLSPGDADADIALRMAGGEFCGNAAMCAAALFRAQTPGEGAVRVRVSGAREPVGVEVLPRPGGGWRCREHLSARPAAETVTLALDGAARTMPLMRFEAIAHLILPGDFDRAQAEAAAPVWCAALGVPALGLMLLDEPAGTLTPLVYVPGADTLYWERSCASGTAAVGAYLAWRDGAAADVALAQPGGILRVSAGKVGEILLRGAVRTLKVGKISA